MNKELKNQLKSVGFKFTTGTFLTKKIANIRFKYQPLTDNFWTDQDSIKCDYYGMSFEEILKVIKDTTGEVLNPEPSKSQRIEALESQFEEMKAKQQELEDLFTASNERLELVIKASGFNTDAIGEVLKIQSQEAANRKIFKVGDEVVLKKSVEEFVNGCTVELNDCRDKGVVLEVASIHNNGDIGIDLRSFNGWNYTALLCETEIEHAPKKELKFGSYAEIISDRHPSVTNFCKGTKVLIIDTDDHPTIGIAINGHSPVTLGASELKPL